MKIKLVIIFAMILSFIACENQDNIVADFGSTSVYFPYQRPARTLVLGEYDLGFNDNDNNGRFEIGVVMSGVFENQIDRRVYFELAPDLIDAGLLGVDSVNVQVLPASYYTIEQQSPVTIPAGSINGRIPIQLEDAFFDDPLSIAEENNTHYVIPLRITDYEELDSLLTGVPIVDNPIKIRDTDWNPAPKDYTLFGIKFMNEYQGVYLRRGEDSFVGTTVLHTLATGVMETTDIDSSSVYRAEFVEKDEVVPVMTSGRNEALVTNQVRRGLIPSNRNVTIEMTFDDNDNCTIANADEDGQVVTGSGKWVVDGDQWGGEERNVLYLEYQYRDLDTIQNLVFGQVVSEIYVDLLHTVKDTLVVRNRDVRFEEFTIELTE